LIVKSWEGVSPPGKIRLDSYVVSLEFPLDAVWARCFSCCYDSKDAPGTFPGGWKGSMLELVVDASSGRLCRLVLVMVSRARYKDVDPGAVVVGDPVFDVKSSTGELLRQRDRVSKGTQRSPSVDQWEHYEVLLGDHRLTILFDGYVVDKAIQVGDHLVVFIDKDREVCGFQITGFTDDQWEKSVRTITKQNPVIEGFKP